MTLLIMKFLQQILDCIFEPVPAANMAQDG